MNHKLLYIFGEKALNESIIKIIEGVNSKVVFSFTVPKDYIYLPSLEKKLNQNNLLICGINENSDEIGITVKKCADINLVDLSFDVTDENTTDYKYIIKLFSDIPDSSVKKLTLKGINDKFTYEEIEKLFFEAYRALSFSSMFYLEYTGAEVSEYLLKGYLEYAGFVEVFPAVSPGEYEHGKIKISSKKGSLPEFAKKPKKVLLSIDSKKPEYLMECSVFIRDLHNKYNNWDLYLISEEWKFFDENIYLKYCFNDMSPEKIDYIIYLDDSNPIPYVDYDFKKLGSRKIDVFYSHENLINVNDYLSKYGINESDFFIIIDTASINYNKLYRHINIKEIQENISKKFKSEFPYIYKIGFKTLLLKEDFNALSLKDKALLIQFSSYYAGSGFNYHLADSLYTPSYNINSGEINYKRKDVIYNYDVSIVIPVYNNFNYTKQCIFSLFKNHPLLNFEIIVIDNGSTDETKEFLKGFQELENFKFIINDNNLGFAKASNQGAEISKSSYILFLNNDTIISKGAIDELYCSLNVKEEYVKSLNVGASGSLLLYPDRKIQEAGIMFEEHLVPYNGYCGLDISECKESDIKNAIYLRSFNALTAACLLVKKKIFFEAGCFDDLYINGFEDVDLCLKLRELGYTLILNPKSIVFHFEEKTPGRKKYDIENINRFMSKWKFKYKRDNYIFAEKDNLFIGNKSESDVSKYIISLNQIKSTEDKIDKLVSDMQYEEALKLCGEILQFDKYNIKIQKKQATVKNDLRLLESKKDLRVSLYEKERKIALMQLLIGNIKRSNKDISISLDEDELYQMWIQYNEPSDIEIERQSSFNFKYNPKISIIMPVYNTPEKYLKKAIDSVVNQTYANWELCISDDASTKTYVKEILKYYKEKDKRIKVVYRAENGHISNASNSALSLMTGDYVALMDHDDELPKFALFFVIKEINDYPDAKLIYSDEDKLYFDGSRVSPYFKSDWNPDLFLSQNMISHLGIYKRSIVEEIGGFREGYEGSQDYDLALRFIEKIKHNEIRHIPMILYHWRMAKGSTALNVGNKSYAVIAARKAVQDHLDRLNIKAEAVEAPLFPIYNRVIYDIKSNPLVSIIILTYNGYELLKDLIGSIFEKTSYKNFEIIVINNNSNDNKTTEYLTSINGTDNINVIPYNKSFNYSSINNFAVKYAKGEILVLLNNDMKVINDDWLREIVSHAARPEVGIVGAKLLYPDDTIQHAGIIIGGEGIATHAYYHSDKDDPSYFGRANLLQNCSAVTGACMAIRRDVYEKAGSMDENLTINYNDIDFCIKVMQLGYYNVYTPYAMLYHYEYKTMTYENMEEEKIILRKEIDYFKTKWGKIAESDFARSANLFLEADALSHFLQHIM